MSPFQSLRDYEEFIYFLPELFSGIVRSTLTIVRRGRSLAELVGEIYLTDGHHLAVYELLNWRDSNLLIQAYSYEAWQYSDKLYWCDSQPHSHDLSLASTDPHHEHVPPNIKHNRIPAPALTFTVPNLPFLIRELEDLIHQKETDLLNDER